MQHFDEDDIVLAESEALNSENTLASPLEDSDYSTSEDGFDSVPEGSDFLSSEDQLNLETFSWDSETSVETLEQNKDAFRRQFTSPRKFFEKISGPITNEAKDAILDPETKSCPTCLDLDASLYKAPYLYADLPERSHWTSFHGLRLSGRRGCRICLLLFNGIAYHCVKECRREDMVEMILGDVGITLRPGHILAVKLYKRHLKGFVPLIRIEFFCHKGIFEIFVFM
jgi:hypothetical protein